MLELTRLPDWDQRLTHMVSEMENAPSEWGSTDCLLTALDAVVAVTGFDPAEDIRGRYKTEAGAARILRKRGLADVEDALASLFEPIGRLSARRGDVGVVERNGALTAGFICDLGFLARTATGRVFLPQTSIKTAFKVG